MAGVERGPSPPSLPGAPESPPPSYLAKPSGAAQSSFPVSASSARQTSFFTLSTSRETSVTALVPATANVLKPEFTGAFQIWRGPESGQVVWIFSEVTPFAFGPRYCGQSAALHRGMLVCSSTAATGPTTRVGKSSFIGTSTSQQRVDPM